MSKKTTKEVEPRVLTEDVRVILRRVIRPDDEASGEAVATIAEKAGTSTRTVYRVLAGTTKTLSLNLADELCLAAGVHPEGCQLQWPDGTISKYTETPDQYRISNWD
jgi:hypothetical protein